MTANVARRHQAQPLPATQLAAEALLFMVVVLALTSGIYPLTHWPHGGPFKTWTPFLLPKKSTVCS